MEVISFTKVSLPYGWLGNMAPYPVKYNNVRYRTTEALFQSLRFMNHPDVQVLIQENKSPMGCKMVAKKYSNLLTDVDYVNDSERVNYTTPKGIVLVIL